VRLMRGKVRRRMCIPASPIPMRHIDGEAADETRPGMPPGYALRIPNTPSAAARTCTTD
jgi:hypothetical protein